MRFSFQKFKRQHDGFQRIDRLSTQQDWERWSRGAGGVVVKVVVVVVVLLLLVVRGDPKFHPGTLRSTVVGASAGIVSPPVIYSL